jgi:hypothetical protein
MTGTITVHLDASFDLHEAGYDNDDAAVATFETAYADAASRVSEASGVEIDVHLHGAADNDLGTELWQRLHDCLERTRAGGWAVKPDVVKRAAAWLRKEMAR